MNVASVLMVRLIVCCTLQHVSRLSIEYCRNVDTGIYVNVIVNLYLRSYFIFVIIKNYYHDAVFWHTNSGG